jgi:hypothetical protein
LTIKNEVARTGKAEVAAYPIGIAFHEGFGVRKLGEAAVPEVLGSEWAGANAEEIRAQRGFGINVLADRGEGGFGRMVAEPGFIMGMQRFTIGEAEERGAIVNLGG